MRKQKKWEDLSPVGRFLNEFKEFAVKGNMIDMAVGIVVGGAFTALVTSIVGNLATPLIGILIGVDFKEWSIPLPRLYGTAEPGSLGIGVFLNNAISFVIVAFTVFLFVKAINKFRKRPIFPPPPPPPPTKEEVLLTEIRDLLKGKTVEDGEV